METVLVTGGTGTLGRHVVERLSASGHQPRVASRGQRPAADTAGCQWATVDYRDGSGLDAALDGVTAVIHCAGSMRDTHVDEALLDAARRAGGPHLIYISIVGVDRIPLGYYKIKLAAEQLIERSGLPWTVQRATQFHELVFRIGRALGHSPIVPLPSRIGVQPIASSEVADRLVELVAGAPAGRVADIGGPEVRGLSELLRAYLHARKARRLTVPLRLPGKTLAAFGQGANLTPEHADGRITFEQALAELPHQRGGSWP